MLPDDDDRLERLVDLIVQLATGDLSARLAPSETRDNIDAVITGINLLAGELQDVHADLELRVAERTRQLEKVTIELERLALRDPLTGLANRTLLYDRLQTAVDEQQRVGLPPAVLLIDLDQFKAINDSFGHSEGDSVLVEVARRLQLLTCADYTIARLGGDEFAILMPGPSDVEAKTYADSVLHALNAPFTIGGRIVHSSASVGLRLGNPSLTGELLLRDADTAMYAAKSEGRGNVQVFHPDMHAAVHDRLTIASDLADAIANGQLFLVYQPIVTVADRTMIGAEALVRWRHPTRGVISPEDFVPIAESTGLVVELGRWVIREAVEQLSRWQAAAGDLGVFRLNINLSPLELRRPDLDTYILEMLDSRQVPPRRLIVELSETTLMTTSAVGMRTLHVLRQAGIHIAIDDFGTGYSSISSLQQLPIDAVKLDRSLVVGIDTGGRQRNLLEAILALIRSVGLQAVAEGVETAEQCSVLGALECHFAQGFHLGRPAAATAIAAHWEPVGSPPVALEEKPAGPVRPGGARTSASWSRLLLLPSAARFGAQAPRDVRQGWDRFWREVSLTGDGGDVLWDSSDPGEFEQHLAIVLRHLDTDLPVVDVGCGNGRQARQLAKHFPAVLGVDLSAQAVDRAQRESTELPNLQFRALDLLAEGAGELLADQLGEANVFVRGVFHVMPPADQARMARALRLVLGSRGRLFLAETNFVGGSLRYLQHLGARPGRIPRPLQRAIQTIPRPRPFGAAELRRCFPAAQWRVRSQGETHIYAIPMQQQQTPEYIPGYYAVLAPITTGS